MATFKVGQRVKKIAKHDGGGKAFQWPIRVPLGALGTVIKGLSLVEPINGLRPELVYTVAFDGIHSGYGLGGYSCAPHTLAPLTDPKADEFIERVKKWKPEPEPVAAPNKTITV